MKIDRKFNTLSKSEYVHFINNHKKYTDFNTLGLYRSILENEKLELTDQLEILDYTNQYFGKTFEFLQIKDPNTYFKLTSLGEEMTIADVRQAWKVIRENQEKILKKKRIKHRNFGEYSKHNCGYDFCNLNGIMIKQGSSISEWCMSFENDKNEFNIKEKAQRVKKDRRNMRNIIEEEMGLE